MTLCIECDCGLNAGDVDLRGEGGVGSFIPSSEQGGFC